MDDKKIKKHKSSPQIILKVLFACMGAFYFGYALGQLTMALPKLNLVFNMLGNNKNLYEGILTSGVPLGAAIGCILAGFLLQKMGRRPIFIICDIVAIVNSGLFLINQYWVAVIARFIMGIIVGINSTVVPLYIREVSPISLSEFTGAMNQGNINLGILVGYLLGLGFPINKTELAQENEFYWRFVLAFPLITCLIRLLAYLFIYKHDTPQYYLLNGKTEEAKKVIEEVYKEEYVNEILKVVENEVQEKKRNVDTWAIVFGSKNRSRLLLGSTLSFFQQLSGINAIVFYSSQIFLNTLGDQQTANYMTVVSGLILMAFAFVSGVFSKRYGRKPILVWGQLFLMVILIGTGVVSYLTRNDDNISKRDTALIITLIFTYEIAFSISSGPLTWVYNADILNSEKSLSLATYVNWMSAFIIGLVFPTLQESWGIYTMFFIFAGFCLIGMILFQVLLKETKGLTQNQIVALFIGNKVDRSEFHMANQDC